MSQIYFAMIDGKAAFFDSAVHGDAIPESAVKISARQHAQLIEGQAAGKVITATRSGKPKLADPVIDPAQRRALLVKAVKREARRRIEAVSPLWRQLNDMRGAGSDAQAQERFDRIDTIRDAARLIEEAIADAPAAHLADFPVTDNICWPEFD